MLLWKIALVLFVQLVVDVECGVFMASGIRCSCYRVLTDAPAAFYPTVVLFVYG